MSDAQGSQGEVPAVPFGASELEGIEQVLWGYSRYLRTLPASEQRAQQIATLERIRERLAAQLVTGSAEAVQVFLDAEEVGALLAAMVEFVRLVRHAVPTNEARDAVLEAITLWRLRLIAMLAESDGDW